MQKQTAKINPLLTAIFLLAFPFAVSFSQELDQFYNSSITAIIIPQNPQPKDTVTIQIDSPLVDLTQSILTWKVDGRVVLSGADKKVFSVKLKGAGQETVVKLEILSQTYGLLEKTFRFNPTRVSLIYEANTYIPPFYKGKALPISESATTLIAIPDFRDPSGQTIQSKDLVFTWKKDGLTDGASSGLGKDYYVFTIGRLPEDTPQIEVNVSSPRHGLSGFASALIPSANPELLLYEDSPLLGVRNNRALAGQVNLSSAEMSFVAYPYYFSGKNKEANGFEYTWNISGEDISDIPKNQSTLTIRSPEGQGIGQLAVSLTNINRLFQTAASNILIKYGQ